ncbi:MAG: hypothetical protein JWO10_334 [Microbacteriaceae bacterium]|nr:hypothetical protein [Microbacteriaceae bacterium]
MLVDGRSGSGKTTFAERFVARHPGTSVLHLDSVYPGWDGLAAGNDLLVRCILEPIASGRAPRWRGWDWQRDGPGEWMSLRPGRHLLVEGAGAIGRASRRLAHLAIWLELDEPTRKLRALERDGDTYAPHWDRWAAQEARFAGREGSRLLADRVLRG